MFGYFRVCGMNEEWLRNNLCGYVVILRKNSILAWEVANYRNYGMIAVC
jgi:hypothetical protein